MGLKSKADSLPFNIGIASSVAREYNYDWKKTLTFARNLNISTVQLYLPLFKALNEILEEVHSDLDFISEFYIHLPNKFVQSFNNRELIDCNKKIDLYIQHEKYLDENTRIYFQGHKLPLGLENDHTGGNIESFLEMIVKLKMNNVNLTAVLDISRFYHQFHRYFDAENIYKQITKILNYCAEQSVPVVFHIIDHIIYEAERKNWVALFSGIIPWTDIFHYCSKIDLLLKSCIFEYEDLNMTKISIDRLLNWYQNEFGRNNYSDLIVK